MKAHDSIDSAAATRSIGRRLRSLVRRAGAAQAAGFEGLDQLEARVLLGGDHPSFALPLTPTSGTLITLDGSGIGSDTGMIDPALDDDLFRFVAPADDFVSIWADTVNASGGSTLNSRVEVYDISGTILAAGSAQGQLTGGFFTDGWAGFVAQSGETYFVRVLSDVMSGPGSTGNYVIRVDAMTTAVTVNPTTGAVNQPGTLTVVGGDIVYKVTAGSDAIFDSVATFQANALTTFDPRLDVYSAAGSLIKGDSQSGRLNDSFLVVASAPDQTVYVRMRSDRFSLTDPTAVGDFSLVGDLAATPIPVDPVTRYAVVSGGAGAQSIQLWSFESKGTGHHIIASGPAGFPPIPDPTLRLYNPSGTLIAFNDDAVGVSAEIQINVQAGTRYYVVVEDFDDGSAGGYALSVEANHTFNTTSPLDDHENLPDLNGTPEEIRRAFERSTPLVWNDVLGLPAQPTVSYLNSPETDHPAVVWAQGSGRIHRNGDTDLFMFVPETDMLGEWYGVVDPLTGMGAGNPERWLSPFIPSGRVQLLLRALDGASFMTAPEIRVYDSNFQLIFEDASPILVPLLGLPPPITATTVGTVSPALFPPQLDPMVDPFLYGAGEPFGLEVFGGEPYFIEVGGATRGRYQLFVMAEAMPDEDMTGFHTDPFLNGAPNWHLRHESYDAEDWAFAREIILTFATGDGSVTSSADGFLSNSTQHEKAIGLGGANPSSFTSPLWPLGIGPGQVGIVEESGLPQIERITDTDLFMFRAPANGSAEVRITTTGLADFFSWNIVDWATDPDPMGSPETDSGTKTKEDVHGSETLNSWLHSALRIFNNDFVEIGYFAGNMAHAGESVTTSVGTATRTYWGRDARAVFEIEAGETYFIQVESGQLQAYLEALAAAGGVAANADFSNVNWRHAIGSYFLDVNAMPNLDFTDDHVNAAGAQATVLPFDDAAGTASLGGFIDHVPTFNPTDMDAFTFISPGTDVATVRVTRTSGDLVPSVAVLDDIGQVIAQANGTTAGVVSVAMPARRGERFFVVVGGLGTSEGGYTVDVSGIPHVDTHATILNINEATTIEILDFLGTGTATGSIEAAGDTDVFRFEAEAFDLVSVTVTGLSGTLQPVVRVYEVQLDAATATLSPSELVGINNPTLWQVAWVDAGAAGGTIAQVSFPITEPDRVSLDPSQTNTFNFYYIVVSGSDPTTETGNYQLSISLTPTDDHPDANQWTFATPLTIEPSTGDGDGEGVIEVSGDTDLFQFTAPAGGFTTLAVTSGSSSPLRPRVRVFDGAMNPIADVNSGAFFRTGPDAMVSSATYVFQVTRTGTFFVLVEGVAGGTLTTDTGAYTIAITAPTIDDHANITEFDIATEIPLAITTGDGLATGVIEVSQDTDLFRFRTLAAGSHEIAITTPGNDMNPVIRVYDGSRTLILTAVDGDGNDEDGTRNSEVVVTLTASGEDEVFYFLVSADPLGFFSTGAYTATIDGQGSASPPVPGKDDHANAGQFDLATPILLSTLTGDGTVTGKIELAGDTDLFVFSALTDGRAFVQIVTPSGSLLDAGVRLFNEAQMQIGFNTEGIPGANAYLTFNTSGPNAVYYVQVDGLGSGIGSYTVQVDTEPEFHFLYFPEGFATTTVREFVSVTNPNDFTVNYTVTLHYEDPTISPMTVFSSSVGPGLRSGVTISDGPNGALAGVITDSPYAVVIRSTGPLGATMAHYDFGLSLGESFTAVTSTTWSFARVDRRPGTINDFIVFYNPNDTAATVTFTAYTSSGVVTMQQTVQAFKRGGWNVNASGSLPTGTFAVVVTSQAANAGDDHIGIVASLSHYDTSRNAGYAILGDPDGGSTHGVIPLLTSSLQIEPALSIFNPTSSTQSITIVGKYLNAPLPDLVRIVPIAARSTLTLGANQLGLISDQPVGLSYSSASPMVVFASEQLGTDGNATAGSTSATTSWFFGDAFINAASAGSIYLETLSFYNPDTVSLPIAITLYFSDGTELSTSVNVAGRGFAQLKLHEFQALLDRGGLNFFGIEVTAARPFVANMTHYDLFLGGGWGTSGAPLGILNPLANILA